MRSSLLAVLLLLAAEIDYGQVVAPPIALPPPVVTPPIVLPPVVAPPIALPPPVVAPPIVIGPGPEPLPTPPSPVIPPPTAADPHPTPVPTPVPTPIPDSENKQKSFLFRFSNGSIGFGKEETIDQLPISIFDQQGRIIHSLLVLAINSTANVAGLASAMTLGAQGAAVATDNNIEVRMSQIRNSSYGNNVFLTEENVVPRSAVEQENPRFGLWVVGTGLNSYSDGTRSKVGTITAGFDYFLNHHMLLGLLGVYGYSDARIPGIAGHLLGNSTIGGLYYGAWTGKPGLYVTLSGLVNNTRNRMIEASNSSLTNWTGFASIGYETSGKPWTFGPVASVQFDDAVASGFTFSDLQLHRNVTTALQSRLGFKIAYKKFLNPQLQLMWEHRYSSNAALDVNFNGIPGSVTSIGEGASNRDSLWGSLSISYEIHHGWSLQGSYNFDLGNQFLTQQVDLGIHVGF